MPTHRFAEQPRVPLSGSERKAFSAENNPHLPYASTDVESAEVRPSEEHITVSVLVRRKTPIASAAIAGEERLTHEEFNERHGADPQSVTLVKEFAKEFGLQEEPDPPAGRRTVQVTGSLANLEKAFGTKLEETQTPQGKLRVRQGAICIPKELEGHIEAVLGLDNRPQAKPHSRVATPHAANGSYSPVQVAQLYGFPSGGAAGETIGIIELGGGYKPADIQTYFHGLGITPPTVTAVSVDKAKNKPNKKSGADGEVMLDIEVAGAAAPGAALAVYFAPNTDQGFIDAITEAVHDTTHKPSVVSISWGGPESSWTQQSMTALDEACQAAAALGVTITVAAGDDGSSDGVTDGANHVDFPASSPHVLACGGTKLVSSGSKISSETVWNEEANNEGATGGGVSSVFAKPSWQSSAHVPAPSNGSGGRGVPDVSGDADPATGYQVRVDGQNMVIGGTSAVAPLWAALIAVANRANGKSAGFINPQLYAASESSTFRDITSGNNGAFKAGPGWDACTGLGSPVGAAIVTAVKASAKPPKHPKPTKH